MSRQVQNRDKPHKRGDVPTFDALRLAVQFRLNRDEGEILAMVTGISLATLEWFAEHGEIDARDRSVLEVYQ
jgi:hypothetical protein